MTRPDLHPAAPIVSVLNLAGIHVTEAAIRKWAQRGHVHRLGTGPYGAALYDPHEVARHALDCARRHGVSQ